MKEIINFSAKFESLEMVNPLITKYRINICVPNKPANKYVFSKEVIEGMSSTIRGAGVYAYFFERDNQIGGHEDDIVKTKYGYKRSGKPVAYGFSDPYKEPYWMEINGEEWYCADTYLWTGRNPEIEEVLDKPVYQSMEVAIDNEEDSFGNKIVKEAVFLGFCLLQGISPAFDGSTIEKFSLPDNSVEIDLLKQEFSKFSSKYDDLDFTIPSGVSKTANRGLELRKEFGYGGTSVGLATARKLSKGGNATPEFVRKVSAYFPRHMGDNLNEDGKDGNPPSRGYIAYCLWGGNAGRTWSNKLVEAMNKRDEEKMSYFSKLLSNFKVGDSVKWNSSGGTAYGKITKIIDNGEVPDIDVKVTGTEDSPAAQIRIYKQVDGEWKSTDTLVGHKLETLNKIENFSKKKINEEGDNVIDNKDTTMSEDENKENMSTDIKSDEMSTENMAEDNIPENENKEEMSSNANVDNTAMQELNDKAAEENKDLSSEQLEVSDEKDKIIAGMTEELSAIKEEMSKMKADMAVYMDENTKLKEFKANIEKQNKDFEVEMTLKEVMSVLPQEEIDVCRMSAEKFSLENIDAWKNEVQAKAFKFSKGITEKQSFTKIGLPYSEKSVKGKGLWD